MAEITISVVLWGFGLKNYMFRLQAHEGVESLGKKKKSNFIGSLLGVLFFTNSYG